jgi:hypothetical protein
MRKIFASALALFALTAVTHAAEAQLPSLDEIMEDLDSY